MAQLTQQVRRSAGWSQLPSITTLAALQLRHIWRLLVLTGLGMIAAVMLACAVPLFALVSMSAGVRDTLTTGGASSYVRVHTTLNIPDPMAVKQATGSISDTVQQYVSSYVHEAPDTVIGSSSYKILSGDGAQDHDKDVQDQLQMLGFDVSKLDGQAKVVAGRLPQVNSQQLEIALPEASAKYLQVTVGSVLTVAITCNDSGVLCAKLPLHVVGLFQQTAPDAAAWHGTSFRPIPLTNAQSTIHGYFMTAMVQNEAMLNAFRNILQNNNQQNSDQQNNYQNLADPPAILWYYHIDPARVNVNNMDDLVTELGNFTNDAPSVINTRPVLGDLDIDTPASNLQPYHDRVAVALLPVVILALLILGLLLLFLSIMADLLVERQTQMIALLRSRGSSSRQIFGAFVVQILFLALVTFIAGPLLAIPVVKLLVQHTLPAMDQEALDLIANPVQTLLSVGWLALVAALISVATMIAAIFRATRMDVLAVRRQAARSSRQPLWLRLYIDVVILILALGGYGFALYMQSTGILDPSTRILLESPISLVSAILLLIAAAMLFLRFVPFFLQAGTRLTARGRQVGPMLAVAQMSRAPQQTLRTALLLTFSMAFVVFVFIFNASQAQHIVDVATYQTGAQFSGTLQNDASTSHLTPAQKLDMLRKIPGIQAAAIGHSSYNRLQIGNTPVLVRLLAVDPADFPQATLWSDQHSQQQVAALSAQLSSERDTFVRIGANPGAKVVVPPLPAVVDASTWQTFKLRPGKVFSVTVLGGTVAFRALAQVPHLPSTNDIGGTSDTNEHGILIDFQSASGLYIKNTYDAKTKQSGTLLVNYTWLSTPTDVHSLAAVRSALYKGTLQIDPLYDRAALIDQGYHDPLYLSIVGVLTLGALVPVLLALVSNLIASWLSVRGRLTNFAMLRALGTSPRQLVSILTWEQGIIYSCALGLGLLFGFLLSWMTLPSLVFSNPSTDTTVLSGDVSFYSLQNIPPIHVTVPPSMVLVVGGLILVCLIVLGTMVRIVSRPSLGQALRLNED